MYDRHMIRKQIHITQAQNDFLEGLEGLPFAEHNRRAIDDYMEKKRSELALPATSPSKMKVFKHGKEIEWNPSQR